MLFRSRRPRLVRRASQAMKLAGFKALTFDCYGTLIDWESGMIAGLKPLTERAARGLGRNEILEAGNSRFWRSRAR